MKVEKWIPYAEAKNLTPAISTTGGFFNFNQTGMRWKDYIEDWAEEAVPYLEAIRQDIIEKKLRMTGEDHQYSLEGVPLFESGEVALFSYRAWGDLMAAVCSEAEDKDYCYMDFYM